MSFIWSANFRPLAHGNLEKFQFEGRSTSKFSRFQAFLVTFSGSRMLISKETNSYVIDLPTSISIANFSSAKSLEYSLKECLKICQKLNFKK